MSWIKDNKFVAALAGGTLVGVILFYAIGSKGRSAYNAAAEEFQTAFAEVESYQRINPYPSADHRDGKKTSLEVYRADLESLQAAFDTYRSGDLKNLPPEEFTNRLKAVNEEVRAALTAAGTKIPDGFYCGFETYQGKLANGRSTGILDYQLEGVKSLMLALAKSKVTELKNIVRPTLSEEKDGKAYQPEPGEVAQELPLELTFVGPEKSARAFLSAVTHLDGRFAVIRSIRISNSKKTAPKTSDVKFESAAPKAGAAGLKVDDIFGAGFVMPDEAEEKPASAGKSEAPAPAPAPAPADSGRVLSQVLGSEEVQVFIRLDFLRFLPAQKLP